MTHFHARMPEPRPLSLTDDQVIALAKVLDSLSAEQLGAPLTGGSEFAIALLARTHITTVATDIINAERAGRR